MGMTPESIKRLRGRFRFLRENYYSEWMTLYKSLADYILPRHGRFHDRTSEGQGGRGDRDLHRYIINGSATRALSIAVAGIKGGLVPHSLPWFRVTLWDDDLADFKSAKDWLHTVQTIMYNTLSKSNFYSAVTTPFLEQLVFGTGPMTIYEDIDSVVRFVPWTAGEYVLSADGKGRVNTGMRWHYMTVQSAADIFGEENLTESSRGLIRSKPDHSIRIVNATFPREHYDMGAGFSDKMPYASVYWEEKSDQDKILKEGGFETQPCVFPRWDAIGEDAFGSNSPGMEAIGDIKMLQRMERDKLEALEKVNKPPLRAPASLKGRLSTLPNKINYMDATVGEQVAPLFQVRPEIEQLRLDIRDVEMRVKEMFYNDLFLMILNDKNMTATEVARRHEEKLAILGPVIERQNSEMLAPLLDRVFEILSKRGMIPPAPPELQGQEMKIEFTSMLAQAQKSVGSASIEKSLAFAGNAASVFGPEVLDTIDIDEAANEYFELHGLKPTIVRSKKDRDAIRNGRAQAAAQQQQMEAASTAASAAKDISAATGENLDMTELTKGIPTI